MPIAFPPDCLISSVIDVSLDFLLAASATDAPLEANFIERDFPIPEDAPIIIAFFIYRIYRYSLKIQKNEFKKELANY